MGLLSCPRCGFGGPMGSPSAYKEGTEEPEPGSAGRRRAGGWEATDRSLNMRVSDRRFLSMRTPTPAAHRGSAASLLGGSQHPPEWSSEQPGLMWELNSWGSFQLEFFPCAMEKQAGRRISSSVNELLCLTIWQHCHNPWAVMVLVTI